MLLRAVDCTLWGRVRIGARCSWFIGTRLALRAAVALPDHAFWPDDVSLIDEAHVDHARLLGPKQITDVYLLALAVKHGGRFVTLDSGISHMAARQGRPENLVVL